MAKVAREMVEMAGVDVDELIELLVNNAAALKQAPHTPDLLFKFPVVGKLA